MGGREGCIDTAIKSLAADTPIVIIERGIPKRVLIGEWIDNHLSNHKDHVKYYPEDRNLEMLELTSPVSIPTCDNYGNVTWGALTAVTRHDPGDILYKIVTNGGRKVTVTGSKSLLIWNDQHQKFEPKLSADVIVGDSIPVTFNLPKPPVIITKVDTTQYFPKNQIFTWFRV